MTMWGSCLDAGTLAVLLIFGTPFIAVAGIVLLKALRIVTGASSQRQHRQRLDDETRQMQELYQGLVAMERRIETLETLLLDRERKEDYQ